MRNRRGLQTFVASEERAKLKPRRLWGGQITLAPNSVYTTQETISSPIRVARSTLRGEAQFYRSAKIVRAIEQQFYLITFLEHGQLCLDLFVNQMVDGPCFVISKASGGYHAFLKSEGDRELIVYQALLPVHILAPFLSRKATMAVPIEMRTSPISAARDLLACLFYHGETLSDKSRASIIDSFVGLIEEAVDGKIDLKLEKKGKTARFNEIEQFIREAASDPELGLKEVAAKFAISERYVRSIISHHGCGYFELLRNARTQIAANILSSPTQISHDLAYVAAAAGFKSLSHFYRSFRQAYGMTPSAYRERRQAEPIICAG